MADGSFFAPVKGQATRVSEEQLQEATVRQQAVSSVVTRASAMFFELDTFANLSAQSQRFFREEEPKKDGRQRAEVTFEIILTRGEAAASAYLTERFAPQAQKDELLALTPELRRITIKAARAEVVEGEEERNQAVVDAHEAETPLRRREAEESRPILARRSVANVEVARQAGVEKPEELALETARRTAGDYLAESLGDLLKAGFSAAAIFLAAKKWGMNDFVFENQERREQFGLVVRQLAQQSLYERTIGRTAGNLTPTEKAERVAADDAHAKLKTLIGATAAAELRQRIKAAAKTQADASKQIDEIIAKVVAENQRAASSAHGKMA